MPDDSNSLGDLVVNVTGDFSDLESSLQGAERVATEAGQVISDAFTGAAETGTDQLDLFGESAQQALQGVIDQYTLFDTASIDAAEAMGQVGDAGETASTGVSALEDALGNAGIEVNSATGELVEIADAAENASTSLHDTANAASEAGSEASEGATGLENLRTSLFEIGEALVITEGLKDFGEEALTAADNVTHASIALTTLTGNAQQTQETLEGLEQVGTSDGIAMPALLTAATRMQAMLGPGADVAELLGQVADGASVMGTDIVNATQRFDQMAVAGTVSARTMQSLGINFETLAAAINTVTEADDTTADSAQKAFKALDQSDRIEVLSTALAALGGTAQQVAQATFGGQWQQLANQWEGVMVQAGQALLPVISELLQLAKTDVLPFIQNLATAFSNLSPKTQDLVLGIGLVVAAIVPLLGGLAAVALAMDGLIALPGKVVELFEGMGIAFTGAGAAATEAAGEIVDAEEGVAAAGVAAGVATPLLIAFGVAIAGWAIYEAVQQLTQLNQQMDNLYAAEQRGVQATSDQGKEIATLTQTLVNYNNTVALTNGKPIVIPKLDPTLPDPINALTTALEGAVKQIPAFNSGISDGGNALKNFQSSGVINIGPTLDGLGGSAAAATPKVAALGDAHTVAATKILAVKTVAVDPLTAAVADSLDIMDDLSGGFTTLGDMADSTSVKVISFSNVMPKFVDVMDQGTQAGQAFVGVLSDEGDSLNQVAGDFTTLGIIQTNFTDGQKAMIDSLVDVSAALADTANAATALEEANQGVTSSANDATSALDDEDDATVRLSGDSKKGGSGISLGNQTIAEQNELIAGQQAASEYPGFGIAESSAAPGSVGMPSTIQGRTGIYSSVPAYGDGGYAAEKQLAFVGDAPGGELIIPMSDVNAGAAELGNGLSRLMTPLMNSLPAIPNMTGVGGGALSIGAPSSGITISVPVTGNYIGSQQMAQQLTNAIQAQVVTTLRQAGLKI